MTIIKQVSPYVLAALIGVLLVTSLGCTEKKADAKNSDARPADAATTGLKIAYVNIDSLESHNELLKKRRDEFKKKQETMENELQQSYQQMQSMGEGMQRKAQSMTQSELQQAEKQLMIMQQSLESRKQSLSEQLAREMETSNRDMKKKLDSFLENYNKDKHYDFILSYSSSGGSAIMYASKQYDITNEVIAGMNSAPKTADTKK